MGGNLVFALSVILRSLEVWSTFLFGLPCMLFEFHFFEFMLRFLSFYVRITAEKALALL